MHSPYFFVSILDKEDIMKAYEIVAYVTDDGECVCPDCSTSKIRKNSTPIFAGDEDWEDMTCSMCDEVLDNSSTFF
jgi:transposase-like protein